MGEFVVVNDVGPRDGLQNQQKILSPDERIRLVRALLAAGMKHVEVAAFVSPKAVPAMAGAADVVAGLAGKLAPEDVQLYYQIGLIGRRDLQLAPDLRGGLEMLLLRMLAFRPAAGPDVPATAPVATEKRKAPAAASRSADRWPS